MNDPSPSRASHRHLIRVWDLPVRLFHWSLVLLIGAAWWSAKARQLELHRFIGYVVLTLILFRLFWGVAGSTTARFSRFVRTPRSVWRYLTSRSPATGAPGHNPLGGWSVMLMLLLFSAQVILGLFAVDIDGLESGPLSRFVSFDQGRRAAELHGVVFNLLLATICLHLLAILFYAVIRRDNLVGPMITGMKRVTVPPPEPILPVSLWRAAIGLALSALLALAVSKGVWLR